MPKLKYNSTTFEHNGYWLRLFFYWERGRWHLEFRKGNLKKYQSLRKADEETAKTEFYRRKLELQKTGYLPEVFDTDLFSQFDIFLDWSRRRSQSKGTYKRHEQTLRRFADFIRNEKIDRITPKIYEKYIDHLRSKSLAPRTIDIHLTAIGKFITVIEKDLRIIPEGTYPRPRLLRVKKSKDPDYLTIEEIGSILDATKNSYLYDMIIFALNTGLRIGEIRCLRWEDIDLEAGHFRVQGYEMDGVKFEPKDHGVRKIKLNNDALDVLKRLEKMRIFSPWVFASRLGTPRSKDNLVRDLGIFYRRAGIEKKGKWHLLRRTFATHLLNAGTGIEAVSKLLGHSELQTTIDSYTSVVQEMDRAVDRLNFGR
ncbi:MAG: site-specific integrase [Deltaproteobacteria bacterium]|uniref:Site-specific integrase n=1 Tax=Candidatus Zymogenus saltonus TaxID=2844893 RepID=A0A9D8PRT6_9DELT|nr:site-specific integrase [Candidatus Zymogenus saltonus]